MNVFRVTKIEPISSRIFVEAESEEEAKRIAGEIDSDLYSDEEIESVTYLTRPSDNHQGRIVLTEADISA